jgi:glycosyltransferase involved in cell wall biosynthesis
MEVFILTRQIEPDSASYESVGNVSVTRFPPHGHLQGRGWKAPGVNILLIVRAIYLLIKNAHRYDIIKVSGFKIFSIPAVLVSKIARKKCVIKTEAIAELRDDVDVESLRRKNLSFLLRPLRSALLGLHRGLLRTVVRRADCIVAISSEIRRELTGFGVHPEKIRSIPNGIDLDRFCPVPLDKKLGIRQRLSLPTGKIILIYTGRLIRSKGLLLLLQIWKELVKRHENVHLVLAGTGKGSHDSCEVELRAYVRLNELTESVLFTGEVSNVHEYLQASDVFVFPTEHEGFSLSLVEALACGLPSVVTSVGAAPELIENHKNGILINPKDGQELKKAIEWLLHHKDTWAKMQENARKRSTEYSMEAVADRYHELFLELHKRGRLG